LTRECFAIKHQVLLCKSQRATQDTVNIAGKPGAGFCTFLEERSRIRRSAIRRLNREGVGTLPNVHDIKMYSDYIYQNQIRVEGDIGLRAREQERKREREREKDRKRKGDAKSVYDNIIISLIGT